MKVLLLGANGQVGWELQRSLAPLGQLEACDRNDFDLSKLNNLAINIKARKPDVIVNAAAYTAVDNAESEEELVCKINTTAVDILAQAARDLSALLVHYSTDYVFDGTKSGVYLEKDIPNPQSVYGLTKARGEDAIRESGCRHLIFRTSWVYATRGSNFIHSMLKLASTREQLQVVGDQTGAPTSAELIADVTALALYKLTHDPHTDDSWVGTYHLTAKGKTSWHGLATYAIEEAIYLGANMKAKPERVIPISTNEYPAAATRPRNSCLGTEKLEFWLNINLPHWQEHVKRMVTETISWDNR